MVRKTKLTFDEVLTQADALQLQLADGWRGVSQNLLALAADLPDVQAFTASASKAESERRTKMNELAAESKWSDEERRRRMRLPQSWSNAKSQIKRIWEEYGTHPREFKTYYALRARLTELRRQTRKTPQLVAEMIAPNGPAAGEAKVLLTRLWTLPPEYQMRVIDSAMRLIDTYEDAAARIEQAASAPAKVAAHH